jgi:hypothetical protein
MATIANVEVKVQLKGNAAGTLGWFKTLVEDSELVIRKTRDGIPGMFLHEKTNRKGEKNKEHEGNTFLCHPATGKDQEMGYLDSLINGINYIYVHPTGDFEQTYIFGEDICFTNYPLTPACNIAISEFIEKAVEEFAVWYEKQ